MPAILRKEASSGPSTAPLVNGIAKVKPSGPGSVRPWLLWLRANAKPEPPGVEANKSIGMIEASKNHLKGRGRGGKAIRKA